MVVIGMVDGVDAMKKERDAAVGELKKVAREAKQYKECLEGGYSWVYAFLVCWLSDETNSCRPLRHRIRRRGVLVFL